jgi:RNA polymerase sigma-70 factor (sigma-E family)
MASREDDFTAFAEAASSRLLNTAYLLCGDWHTAEDLTQTALARVFASWHRIREPDAVHAYARRTLLNAYFVDCRRTRRGEILIAELPDPGERATPGAAPELRLALMDALATLPPRARAIVILRYWEDLSVDQVAAQLGCSAGNVKSQSSRTLARLRRLLGDIHSEDDMPHGAGPAAGKDPREAEDGRDIPSHAI